MNKKITTQIKGIAILLMIWLHCFHTGWYTHLYCDYTFMGDYLSSILTRLTGPVEFFIILSGYGLYCLYRKNLIINIVPRALKLYLLFLFCFIIFISIGCFLKPEVYPGSLATFIANITTWHTSYNETWWFLFPYLIILVCSNYIFKLFEYSSLISILGSAMLYFIGYGTSWLSAHAYIHIPYAIHQLITVVNFLFPFLIGSSLAKYDIIKIVRSWYLAKNHRFIFLIGLVVIIFTRISTSFDFILQITYTLAIIFAYAIIPHFNLTKKVLQLFGTHSTSMWFVHAFFNMYLFTNHIYALKYPIFIYLVCVSLSLVTAFLIDSIFTRAYSYFSAK